MKSAKDWSKQIGNFSVHCHGADEEYPKVDPLVIAQIQADAIYHVAEFVGEMPIKYNRMHAWDGPYRAACVFARSHLREMAADLTRCGD